MGAGPDRGLDMSRYVRRLWPCWSAADAAVEWWACMMTLEHKPYIESDVMSAHYCT